MSKMERDYKTSEDFAADILNDCFASGISDYFNCLDHCRFLILSAIYNLMDDHTHGSIDSNFFTSQTKKYVLSEMLLRELWENAQ